MRVKRLQLFLAVGLLAFCLPGLAGEITLGQADGSALILDSPATRIVTLSPHLAELMFAAGAGDRLIATVEYSNYPESAISIPRVGDAFRLDSERILALQPDLVIAWDSGNPRPAIAQLRSLGLPVWSIEIRKPVEIADTIEAMGRATGHVAPANRAGGQIRRRLSRLSMEYKNTDELSFFYQVGKNPLFTINGAHLISQGLAMCKGRNVFEKEPGLAFQVGYESVIVANPDALFSPFLQEDEDPLFAWREWPAMKAVSQNALYLLPADAVSRATPRFLDALELACKLLHGLPEKNTHE